MNVLNKLGVTRSKQSGFTLIEILVVIGIIAILAVIVLIAINPARQFKQARDTQRVSNVNSILNAVGQNIADNRGLFKCGGVTTVISTTNTVMASTGGFNIRPCIVPLYMTEIPVDPSTGTPGSSSYDTKYFIQRDSATDRITVSAPDTEIATPDISVSR